MNEYNDKVGSLWNENVKKVWNYYINIMDYNLEVMVCSIKIFVLNGIVSIYFLKVFYIFWKIFKFFVLGGVNNIEIMLYCCKFF